LLDYLATEFVKSGWSVKAMHRMIMLSATYQTASTPPDPRASASIDPENRLLGHTTPQRLDAESIRDATLAVAGTLDRTAGGPCIAHRPNREYFADLPKEVGGSVFDAPRRSVYLPVVRNTPFDAVSLFDGADACVATGDRATTTVAPQALYMMNAPFMLDSSKSLAKLILDAPAGATDDAARVRTIYLRAFGRPADDAESKRAVAIVANLESLARQSESDNEKCRSLAWTWFCQTVLASNEFVYVN
jgi:hypothetical protein